MINTERMPGRRFAWLFAVESIAGVLLADDPPNVCGALRRVPRVAWRRPAALPGPRFAGAAPIADPVRGRDDELDGAGNDDDAAPGQEERLGRTGGLQRGREVSFGVRQCAHRVQRWPHCLQP